MATIDPRLLPLIETLVAVDADWLALEILDGLRLGIVAEEIPEHLLATQLAVREARRQERLSEERAVPPPVAKPIVGVQKQLRNSDPRITLGIYGHVVSNQQRDAVENRSARIAKFAVN